MGPGDSKYEEVVSLVLDSASFNRDVTDVYNTFKRNADNITRELQVATDQGVRFYVNMQKAAASAVKTMYGDVLNTKETLNNSLREIAEKEDAIRKQQYKDEAARLRQSVAEKVAATENAENKIRSLNKSVAADLANIAREEARQETVAREQAVRRSVALIQERRNAENRAHLLQMREINEYISAENRAARAAIQSELAGTRSTPNRINAAAQVASRMGLPGSGMLTDMAYAGSNAGRAMGGISGSGVAAIGVLTALTGGIMAAISAGSKLEDSLASMATLMNGAGQNTAMFHANLEMLTEQASILSVKFNKDINEVVRGFKEALSAGIDEADIFKFSDTAGTLANAIGTDIQSTTNVLTTFKDAYGLTINDLTAVNNQLFKAIDVGKISVQQLNGNIGKLIPTAATAGISITDMLSGVAALSRIMPTNQAITSLNKLIEDIVTPSDKAAKAFKELGIETGQAQFQIKGLGGVIEELAYKSQGKLDILGQLFPEQRGLRAAGGLSKMLDLFHGINKEIAGSTDSMIAFEASIVATDTASNKLGRFWKSQWNEVTVGANKFLEVLSKITTTMVPGGESYFDEIMWGDRGMTDQAKFVAEAVAAEKQRLNEIAEINRLENEKQSADALSIGNSISAIHPAIQKSIDLTEKFGTKLNELGESDKWRVDVVNNYDKMTAEIIARMEKRKEEIVKISQEMFRAYGGDPLDYAQKAQSSVDTANQDDADLLAGILKNRNEVANVDTAQSKWKDMWGKLSDIAVDALGAITKEGEKILAQKSKIAQDALSEFDKLYKKDTELYEAAEKKKAAIQEKYSQKIMKIEEDRIASINKLNDLNREWENDKHAGDPNALARNARKQREQSTAELRTYVDNGGGDARRIAMLRDDIIKALSIEHDNSGNAKSDIWVKLEAALLELFNKGAANETKNVQAKEAKEIASNAYNRMSPEEIARAAAAKTNAKQQDAVNVKQEISLELSVNANGIIDEKGLKFLEREMIKRIALAQKQNVDNTNLPRSGYPDRSPADAP